MSNNGKASHNGKTATQEAVHIDDTDRAGLGSSNQQTYNKRDLRLLDAVIWNQMRLPITLLVVGVALIIGLWYWLAGLLLDFGRGLTYQFLEGTAADVLIEPLKQYDIYFWWALVVIISLFVLSFIYNMVRSGLNRYAQSHPPMRKIAPLLQALSPQALDVLAFVWQDRRMPLTLKQLKDTRVELSTGRYARNQQAREQARLLQAGLHNEAQAPTAGSGNPSAH